MRAVEFGELLPKKFKGASSGRGSALHNVKVELMTVVKY